MAAQVSSGSISIGANETGAATRSINYIIGEGVTTIDTPSTVQRSLNDDRSRLLAQKTSAGSAISFSDFSKSSFAISISGLFCFDKFIASLKVLGIFTIAFELFFKLFGSFIFPIIFS